MRILLTALTLCACTQAQTLVDYTAAAAGGSVGTMAGKKVSDGLDKVLGRAAQQAGKAAAQGAPAAAAKPAAQAVGIPQEGAVVSSQAAAKKTARRRTDGVVATQFVGPVLPPEPEAAPAPPPPPLPPPGPTAEEIASVKPGTAREDLVALLGKPAGRMTMSEEGHLLETYHFRARSGVLARIRLTDGAVSTVEVPREN